MPDAHEVLRTLSLVLCVAAATTLVCQWLRQPVIFGYLIAGVIVGPHIPIPLVADEAMVHTMAELGVVLLMFALGLEFSLRKLFAVGATASLIAVLQSTAMMSLGFLAGQAFGWTTMESLFSGAIIAVSSTTIIVKAFAEQRVTGRFTQVAFGVLIIQDLIAILLLAVLTAISAGSGVSAAGLLQTAARLGAFLVGLVVVGLLLVPRLFRLVTRLNRPETTTITAVAVCFGGAYLALSFGYSVALGAFLAGSLVAESGEEKVIEPLIGPVRDMFAAIFFVAVGMLIDPRIIAEHWVAVLVFTAIVIGGNIVAVTIGAFVAGYGTRTSIQTGMSLAQIGEFSFIIAGVGLATHATRDFLYPVAVAVSAITTLTTPWLIRASGPVASFVDRRLPRPIQNFAGLYGSWMDRVRAGPDKHHHSRERRLARLLLLDAALLIAIVVGTSLYLDVGAEIVERMLGVVARHLSRGGDRRCGRRRGTARPGTGPALARVGPGAGLSGAAASEQGTAGPGARAAPGVHGGVAAGYRLPGQCAVAGRHPVAPAPGGERRLALPASPHARDRVLAQRDEPAGAHPSGRRSDRGSVGEADGWKNGSGGAGDFGRGGHPFPRERV